jgi:hypothetical protein
VNADATSDNGETRVGDNGGDEPSADEIEHIYDAPREHQGEAEPHLDAVPHQSHPAHLDTAVKSFAEIVEAPAAPATIAGNGHHQPPTAVEAKPAEPAPVVSKPEAAPEPKPAEVKPHERSSTPPEQIAVVSSSAGDGQPRKGWWQRRFSGE